LNPHFDLSSLKTNSILVLVHTICDNCKNSVKKVGKLFKVKFMYLCKLCRSKVIRH